ncbi:hypothetical protein JYU12_02395 [bacterium AH-315-K03]|nr:hypothetical protein [bacterium AH-315-K03]
MINWCCRITGYSCIAMLFLVLGCTQAPEVKPELDREKPALDSEGPELELKKTAPDIEESELSTQQPEAKIAPVVEKSKPISKKPIVKILPIDSLAILLNEDNSRFQQIADALKQQMDKPTELFYLNAMTSQKQVLDRLQASSHRHVVAIGSAAANSAKRLKRKRVVFAQVFNYQTDKLLAAGFSGVSMIPSTQVLITQWKKTSPALRRLAVITGEGNEQQLAKIIAVAKKQQVTIEHHVVNNDKEMLYTAKQVAQEVDGFWLLPDSRVLSLRGMKDFMSFISTQNKQVAVFNRELLKFGGLFYVSANSNYVAKQIIQAVNGPAAKMLMLDEAQIEINEQTIERLSLNAGVI